MTPPTVTIVAHDIGGPGGMERQLEQLIRGLLGLGAEVTVISRTCRLPVHSRMRWVRVRGPRRPFPLAFPWFYLVGSVIAWRQRRGLLHSTGAIIGNRVDLTTAHFCHRAVRRQGGLRRRRRANRAYALNAWLSSIISESAERWSYRSGAARGVVGVSTGVAREIGRCYPSIAHVVEAIPNGVDIGSFRPDAVRRAVVREALALDDGALVAVFVGGEWEGKGLRHAIDAIAPRPAWHLAVVGRGDRARYSTRAAAAGCADRVHFLGQVKDVRGYYAAADAFVLPSRYETFSLVAFEAAASALPLLVTRVSGVEEILRDGLNGWFIGLGAETIEPRLAALERDASMRERMGREARAAVRRFDWPSVVFGYCNLYARLAANGGGLDRPDPG
jgi:UDP-glucose:(heptosyl)LPS alpha-1,3-glucosyltransferase